MPPKWRGVLLCEDKEHEDFFRPLLSRWFGKNKIRVERIPNNRGAGSAFVLKKFPELFALARRKRFERYALVVAIDGDRDKLRGRLRQLDQQLESADLPKRGGQEMVVICVPTWSIETWELWLCGDREVDENIDCKHRLRKARRHGEAGPKKAVESWFRPLSAEERLLEQKVLPALAAGRDEIKRFDE